jgi:hypothetical protein
VPEQQEVSHADIYHKLGSLEAKLDAAITSVIDYKATLNEAFSRIRKLEDRMIWTIGAVAGISIIIPIMIHTVSSSFDLELRPKVEIQSVQK